MDDLLKSMVEFSEQLSALQLSEEKLGLFTAVVLISADCLGIEKPASVEQLQETLIQVLQVHILKNYPQETSRFTKLLLKLKDQMMGCTEEALGIRGRVICIER
uniref:NR LBD domain-containing protein n=1 Tax=Pseudonaja textilis TaxID=8673 RepID=A0A670ZNW1_PSETE